MFKKVIITYYIVANSVPNILMICQYNNPSDQFRLKIADVNAGLPMWHDRWIFFFFSFLIFLNLFFSLLVFFLFACGWLPMLAISCGWGSPSPRSSKGGSPWPMPWSEFIHRIDRELTSFAISMDELILTESRIHSPCLAKRWLPAIGKAFLLAASLESVKT